MRDRLFLDMEDMAGYAARGTIACTAGFITTLYVGAPQAICFSEKPLLNGTKFAKLSHYQTLPLYAFFLAGQTCLCLKLYKTSLVQLIKAHKCKVDRVCTCLLYKMEEFIYWLL